MPDQPTTIAVIADIHYGAPSDAIKRRCEIADVLLQRTVYRLNRLIKPDVTLVLGDVIDDGSVPNAEKDLLHIRSILDKLDSPYIAIPGNHDGDVEQFYRAFERPKDIEDIAGIRFLPFVDKDEPRYCSSRIERDLNRMREARSDYNGQIVSLQHVCLCPPVDQPVAPYNFTNAEEVIGVMKEAGINLSISGHHHCGGEDTKDGDITFLNVAGLCESPFPFTVITVDGDEVKTQRHELMMPAELQLTDNHVHTPLAYCSENMDVLRAIGLAREFGLAGITFTEHSGQLYFEKKRYWNKICLADGMDAAIPSENRMAEYLAIKKAHEQEGVRFGLEVDCDYDGRDLVTSDDRKQFDFFIGALHALPSLTKDAPPSEKDRDYFLFMLEKLLTSGIDVLAHPMRVFRRSGWETPVELLRPTAELLKKHGTAAEINFHSNEPHVDFVRACLELGVKFSFGSDGHNLAEIGDFAYHLELLKDAGFDGDLTDILI